MLLWMQLITGVTEWWSTATMFECFKWITWLWKWKKTDFLIYALPGGSLFTLLWLYAASVLHSAHAHMYTISTN